MTIKERVFYFTRLGDLLRNYDTQSPSNFSETEQVYFEELQNKITAASLHNGWFSKENIHYALKEWAKALTKENLENWIRNYQFSTTITPKTVAVIMASNIPLVGFHDFLSVLISGHTILIKQSDNDKQLLPVLCAYLKTLNAEFESKIKFTENKLDNFDAVIATGSNNTARYFEYYFKDKPNIIRKNRNSVAILTGEETAEDFEALAEDIFRYYGLGCRNVSKIFVPKNYNFDSFYKGIFHWKEIINQNKYANNYDYNKAVYLMSEFKMLDNGFLMVKEDKNYGSPISVLFYEEYENRETLQQHLNENKEKLQCVVSKESKRANEVTFGNTQHPRLWDYADGIDTLEFLINLN
ncbi:acyl-CoA reductase [Zunongwangia sp.]|uniref:acyl-CoA reductase n=1 Tax=Zunongwangia sp. TaxID=1965325 RepID=UPI003AA8A0EF